MKYFRHVRDILLYEKAVAVSTASAPRTNIYKKCPRRWASSWGISNNNNPFIYFCWFSPDVFGTRLKSQRVLYRRSSSIPSALFLERKKEGFLIFLFV